MIELHRWTLPPAEQWEPEPEGWETHMALLVPGQEFSLKEGRVVASGENELWLVQYVYTPDGCEHRIILSGRELVKVPFFAPYRWGIGVGIRAKSPVTGNVVLVGHKEDPQEFLKKMELPDFSTFLARWQEANPVLQRKKP